MLLRIQNPPSQHWEGGFYSSNILPRHNHPLGLNAIGGVNYEHNREYTKIHLEDFSMFSM